MRRAHLAAVALAPLLAAVGGTAFGQCVSATNGSNVTLASGCALTPSTATPGFTVNSSNTLTVNSGATISNTDVSNSVGILIEGGNTGSVDNEGSISLGTSYVPPTFNNFGIANGAFSSGDDRYGIEVTGGQFTGSIDSGSLASLATGVTAGINVDGDNSYGIWFTPTGSITGNLTTYGAITVLGNQTIGINIAGPNTPGAGVGGNLTVGGAVTATGVGAQGVVTSAPIGGALTIQNTITSTGYRSTSAPTSPTILFQLTPDQLQQGGSAVVVGGDVGQGITIGAARTMLVGTATVTISKGTVTTFGDAPAMEIGASGQSVTIGAGAAASEPYDLVIGGEVAGAGVYDPFTATRLPGPVSATGLLIGSADETGSTDLADGIHVQASGGIIASALTASATAVHVASGASISDFVNDGIVAATSTLNQGPPPGAAFTGAISGTTLTVSGVNAGSLQVGQLISGGNVASGTVITAINTSGNTTVYTLNRSQSVASESMTGLMTPQVNGIVIDSGGNLASIVNNRSIAAEAATTVNGATVNVSAIADYSGNLTSITNTGSISATTAPSSNLFTVIGNDSAIDVSSSTSGVTITQKAATPSSINASISGFTLTVNSVTAGEVQVGQAITGTGVPSGTYIVELTGGDGGAGSTYDLNNSVTVGSEGMTVAPATAVFTGTIVGTTLSVGKVTSGVLQVGQTITGPGIAPGTTITDVGNGSGGVGTYKVNISQAVASEVANAAVTPSITGDILFGDGHNVLDVEAGQITGAVTELPGQSDLTITVNNALLDITKAEAHPIASLTVGSTGVLDATLDPTFAIGGSNPTAIFDTTAQNGTATFASGAQIGVRLDAIQDQPTQEYVFVHTGAAADLSVGTLGNTTLSNAPYLYTATASVGGVDANDLDVTVTQKNAAQLGLNSSETAAFNAIIAASKQDAKVGALLAEQTSRGDLISLYDQMVPDQGIGTFEALEAATQKISQIAGEPPDAGVHVGGTSLWLQEVNQRVDRETTETLGSNDKVFGLVGGLEKTGDGGGGLGLTLAYLNIEDEGSATAVGGHIVGDLLEGGAYYRRAWRGLNLSVRGAGGIGWFSQDNEFLTTGLSETSHSKWTGVFADAHAGVSYQFHFFRRFYLRPEIDADYLYLNEDAHNFGPGSQVVNLSVGAERMDRMSGAAILTLGAQYGHDEWFRPEIYGGYREVFAADFGNTIAQFNGGLPFSLPPGDTKGGWVTLGFALKAGTELSYLALEGDAAFRSNEQRFDVFFVGRTLF